MTPVLSPSALYSAAHPSVARLSVEQYQKMAETGILPEAAPIELLDGLLILKDRRDRQEDAEMTIGHEHSDASEGLQEWLRKNLPDGFMFRIQQPLLIPPSNVPEPDMAIVRGRRGAFKGTHPKPGDVVALFEIAHTSLVLDRTTKLKLYAAAGIEKYILINLKDRQAEIYTQPLITEARYGSSVAVPANGELKLNLAPGLELKISMSEILP